MSRLDQRKRGPRRRQTGAEPVTNPFEAIFLVFPRAPLPDTPENRERVASARRLMNRRDLEQARRDLEKPEPSDPYTRRAWVFSQGQAREVVKHFEANPGDYYVGGVQAERAGR